MLSYTVMCVKDKFEDSSKATKFIKLIFVIAASIETYLNEDLKSAGKVLNLINLKLILLHLSQIYTKNFSDYLYHPQEM